MEERKEGRKEKSRSRAQNEDKVKSTTEVNQF
jgi:hypothetical protein